MKNAIITVIVFGMLGFAVYEFLLSDESDSTATEEEDESKDMITSAPLEPEEEEQEDVSADSDQVGLDEGQIAPDFELETLNGETVKLSDYRGERVMLNFWATWCPPCRVEMPDMQKFHENKNIVILAVNLTETEPNTEKVKEFLEERELTFSVLLDEKTTVANEYQIQPIPSTFLIDSNGRIHNKAFGALNYDLMVQEFEKMQ